MLAVGGAMVEVGQRAAFSRVSGGHTMRYEFIVEEAVPGDVAAELPELRGTRYPTGGTSLFGPVRDEADVETLLARLVDLHLSVVEVRRLPD
jgi:hypothetical protein